jgi:hypothetical protein
MGDVAAPAIFSYAMINVESHVSIVLDLKLPNNTKWSAFFTAMCGKFGLLGHINGSIPARPMDRTWSQPDSCVRSWLYGCVNDNVLDLAMEPNQTAVISTSPSPTSFGRTKRPAPSSSVKSFTP